MTRTDQLEKLENPPNEEWKWRIILAVAMAAMFAANHVEHYLRAERIRRQAQERDVPVVQVVDNAAGHSSIQIDEQTHRSGYLYFNTLESWAFSKENPDALSAERHGGQRPEGQADGLHVPAPGGRRISRSSACCGARRRAATARGRSTTSTSSWRCPSR